MSNLVDLDYVDNGELREQDRVSLEVFLADHDRTQITGRGQPFFSGREREIRAFRKAANALSLGRQGNATIVVEGPPGAGKTALLTQLQEEMRGFPPTESGGRRWLPVVLDGSSAMSPPEIMESVDEAIATRLAEDMVAAQRGSRGGRSVIATRLASLLGQESTRDMLSAAQGILDRGVSGMGFSIGARGSAPPRTMQAACRLRARDWIDWQIVLLFDEAQDISAEGREAAPGTLKSIHQGLAGSPVSFCAFGLPGTWDALARVGISRASVPYDLPMAGLDEKESRTAVRRCFKHFGVEHGEAWVDAIVERSADWPQHLATYKDAAMRALKAKAHSPERMGDARKSSLSEAISLGDEGRRAFYKRRVESLVREEPFGVDYAQALVPMLRSEPGGVARGAATARLMSHPLGLSRQEAGAFLSKAAHCGLIATDADGLRFVLAIPSFAAHLLGEVPPPIIEPEPSN